MLEEEDEEDIDYTRPYTAMNIKRYPYKIQSD